MIALYPRSFEDRWSKSTYFWQGPDTLREGAATGMGQMYLVLGRRSPGG